MCMLTAMVPMTTLAENDIILGKILFTSLILRNAISNRDGFGLASTNKSHYKSIKPAYEVMFSDPCISAITGALGAPLIGHVRTTSTGRTAKDGSHPFFVGPLAVAHNGTFSNYKEMLRENPDISKEIDDPDPVDSNVFAHLLGKIKGKGSLTSNHIAAALGQVQGSYAVLVAERDQDFIWVVRGANGLYQATVGPYQVVNTSRANLKGAVSVTADTLKLLFGLEFQSSEVTAVPTYGVYKLLSNGLTKQLELSKPAVIQVTYNYTGWQGRGYLHAEPTSEVAVLKSELAHQILMIPGITYKELEIATGHLCENAWYEAKVEDLRAVKQTLEVLSSRHYTPEKELIWGHIRPIVGDYEGVENILTLMGSGRELYFPYFLHIEEELKGILELIRGGDNVIIS